MADKVMNGILNTQNTRQMIGNMLYERLYPGMHATLYLECNPDPGQVFPRKFWAPANRSLSYVSAYQPSNRYRRDKAMRGFRASISRLQDGVKVGEE